MEADFSGYASKNGLKCSDGRTIAQDAFKANDKQRVPLIWSHMHDDPANVLGHALLENRPDGVYTYGFFNDTPQGQNAKNLVKHGDIVSLSIFANNLIHKGANVVHGAIREVSLVLAGANPGAMIDNVSMAHGDDSAVHDDEAIIYTGLTLEHGALDDSSDEEAVIEEPEAVEVIPEAIPADIEPTATETIAHADTTNEGATVATEDTETVQDVVDTMSDKQKEVLYFLVGQAAGEDGGDDGIAHSALNSEEGYFVPMNVFDQNRGGGYQQATLSHDQLKTITDDAAKIGSFKESILAHAQEYGIENIDILFPDAKALSNSPEIIGRRTEWVAGVLNDTKHSPFTRIKSTAVDLTADQARAKGYVKGSLKKEEVIKLLKRVTTPTTIYKKQKLDRDDILDITDLNVVAWLKAEMRLMLDEELARAILIGDGREADDEDKIDEDHLRPIASDDDMYAHKVNLQSSAQPKAIEEGILRSRNVYKGSGTPAMYTTDAILTDLLLQEDKIGRRKYDTEAALASALRVSKIVTVEPMLDTPEIVAVLVNLADYTVGADKGGEVSMFDDFDIDYNQYKYLIETRVSGCLTKPKSAIVIKRAVGTIVTPPAPSYNGTTKEVTYPDVDGVVYRVDGVPQTGKVTISEVTDIEAYPATGYSFPKNSTSTWVYVP